MTMYERGSVVIVRFPNSSLGSYKNRPALVVQDEGIPTGVDQCIVAMITSNLVRTGPSRVRIGYRSAEGRAMGLRIDSVIMADNLATVRTVAIAKVIGFCTAMDQIDAALCAILRLNPHA